MKKSIWMAVLPFLVIFMLAAAAQAGPIMDRILEKEELVIGLTATQPPLSVKAQSGQIIGLDADLAKSIALNMGVNIKFTTMKFAELLPALKAGKIDMIISSMTMTPRRNLNVAFVGPYYVSGKGILTKARNIAEFQAAHGLNKDGFKVAALKNSTSQDFVTGTAPKATLVKVQSYDEALELLFQDKINALIADYPFCAFSAYRHKDKGLVAAQSKLTFEPLGIAVQEDALLINWLQNFMIMLQGSGQLELMHKRWFDNFEWIQDLP